MSNRNTIRHYLPNDNKSLFDLSLVNKYFSTSFIIYIGIIIELHQRFHRGSLMICIPIVVKHVLKLTRHWASVHWNFNGLIVITVRHFLCKNRPPSPRRSSFSPFPRMKSYRLKIKKIKLG